MENINKVLLVPGAGHINGEFSLGNQSGRLNEYDLSNQVIAYMSDILENHNIKHSVVPIKLGPGLSNDEIMLMYEPATLVIKFAFRKSVAATRLHNQSDVYHSPHTKVRHLAEAVSQALADWGTCAVYGHMAGKTKKVSNLPFVGLEVAPFLIDGPHAKDYAKRTIELGRDLAYSISDFLTELKMARQHNPASMAYHLS